MTHRKFFPKNPNKNIESLQWRCRVVQVAHTLHPSAESNKKSYINANQNNKIRGLHFNLKKINNNWLGWRERVSILESSATIFTQSATFFIIMFLARTDTMWFLRPLIRSFSTQKNNWTKQELVVFSLCLFIEERCFFKERPFNYVYFSFKKW